MKKQHALVALLATSALFFTACTQTTTTTSTPPVAVKEVKKDMLTISKTTFASNEDIVVDYAVDKLSQNAWIGIIPSETAHGSESTNDQYDVAYQYLSGSTAGSKTLTAPAKPGKYDLRLSDAGKELFSVTFTVEAGIGADIKPAITLTKTKYKAGEALAGEFMAPSTLTKNAWIGIIPSKIAHGTAKENDANDVSYQYLSGKTQGKIDMLAPAEKGSYDVRMSESESAGGAELATITFTVE